MALTGILLLGGIFAEANQRGLTPAQVLAAIPLLIPNTFPYTLPTTTLFATCVIYGRLAHDNEILAMKAAGINLLQIILPAIFLGILVSIVTFLLYLEIIPTTQNMLITRLVDDVEELLYSMLKRDGYLRDPKMGYVIYVKRVEGRTLNQAQFLRRDPNSAEFDVIAWAHEAELHVDMEQKQVIVTMRNCYITSPTGDNEGVLMEKDWSVDMPQIYPTNTRPNQLVWKKLFEREEELRVRKEAMWRALSEARDAYVPGDELSKANLEIHEREYRRAREDLGGISSEIQMRPSISLGCLCFVLVGCPIGIWFSKSDYLSAFITCFLPIVLFYYPLLLCGLNLSKSGTFPPIATLWVANGLMAVAAALFLFHRLLKD